MGVVNWVHEASGVGMASGVGGVSCMEVGVLMGVVYHVTCQVLLCMIVYVQRTAKGKRRRKERSEGEMQEKVRGQLMMRVSMVRIWLEL